MVIGVLTALLIYFVTNIISNNKLISLLSVLVYLAWGPTHINFPWPSTFAFSLGLIAAYFLFKKEFFYSGLLTAITLLIAESNPRYKDKMVALVVELLRVNRK